MVMMGREEEREWNLVGSMAVMETEGDEVDTGPEGGEEVVERRELEGWVDKFHGSQLCYQHTCT